MNEIINKNIKLYLGLLISILFFISILILPELISGTSMRLHEFKSVCGIDSDITFSYIIFSLIFYILISISWEKKDKKISIIKLFYRLGFLLSIIYLVASIYHSAMINVAAFSTQERKNESFMQGLENIVMIYYYHNNRFPNSAEELKMRNVVIKPIEGENEGIIMEKDIYGYKNQYPCKSTKENIGITFCKIELIKDDFIYTCDNKYYVKYFFRPGLLSFLYN